MTKSASEHKISVKNLIGLCCRSGNLSSGYVSRTRALEGIREHTRIQGLRPENYKKEVAVTCRALGRKIDLEIYGRIDGVFESDDIPIIEEIKTCRTPAREMAENPAPAHLAQLKCYGFMLAAQMGLDQVNLQLTYVAIPSGIFVEKKENYTFRELEKFFFNLVHTYIAVLEDQADREKLRNNSIQDLDFPYPDFRPGQRLLAESVYKIIKNEKILFARAPTGTGKTIATLFPAIKALGLGQVEKIFYLTAKTVGRTVAIKAINDMRSKGLHLKSVVITAKQKICFMSDETCDVDVCPYAAGYYDKLETVVKEITGFDDFSRQTIESLARQYEICPFELSLDISNMCDVVICDLNYCFDPRVYLKRYFEHSSMKATFLIDEAHNLHDRIRSMYSAHLIKSDFLKLNTLVRESMPDISKSLLAVNKLLIKIKQGLKDPNIKYLEQDHLPEDLLAELRSFAAKADHRLDSDKEDSPVRTALLDAYFQVNIFLVISQFFENNYRFYAELIKENDLIVRIFCLDPSPIFSDLIHRCRSCTLFSATLSPLAFHRDMLFNDKIYPYTIDLPSPFPVEHLGIFVHRGIRTAYRHRDQYYKKIADLIENMTAIKPGNYMIYFPSYAFLHEVLEYLAGKKLPLVVQHTDMTETDRQEFLDEFKPDSAVTGMAVMGGIFGEGIDLTCDRLIGAVIISPAIPQICTELDLIRNYYDDKDNTGFFKAYQMPGFNRVMQAAGRVIRTDTDTGIVVLVDERFNRPDYRCLFPPEWQGVKVVETCDRLYRNIDKFWKFHSNSKNS